MKTKMQQVEKMLTDAGFEPDSFGFTVIRGPKVKSDILECWSTGASNGFQGGRHVLISSAYTMTELVKTGLKVVPNRRETCLYGDYVAEPDSPNLSLAQAGDSVEQSLTNKPMQAIQTKFIPATNYKGSRIKASCERGSITISYPDELSGDACHIAAADALVAKFVKEDEKRYGTKRNPWQGKRVCGWIPKNICVHVYVG